MSEQVWWCQVHQIGDGDPSLSVAWKTVEACYVGAHLPDHQGLYPCEMVERLLVDPVSTLIVEKGEDGEWPEWAVDEAFAWYSEEGDAQLFDALKVASDSQGKP